MVNGNYWDIPMNINSIKRPWERSKTYGIRAKKEPFYHSSEWQRTRTAFIASKPWIQLPNIGTVPYSNKYCVDCWNKGIINDKRIEIDHVKRIEDGGSKTDFNNLLSRCHSHHCSKSAKEGNQQRYDKNRSN